MKTTKARRQLINDAHAAGFRIIESDGCIRILTGKTYRSIGIALWPDGTATRTDIDLSLCTAIRTITAMRSVLGL